MLKCDNAVVGEKLTRYKSSVRGCIVRATCLELVGHPQALQENRSKSCLVSLHCGIPKAYKILLQEHKVYKFV